MASPRSSSWPVPVLAAGRCSAGTLLFRWGGAPYLTVVAKIACGLVPGGTMRRLDAPELIATELHHRDNPTRTIRATPDLVPYLPRVDVLFTGHVHPPAGRSVASMPVRLAVQGEGTFLDKTLLVHGKRSGGAASPLASSPLVYERAFGGIGFPDNPHGTGFAPDTPLPDIEVPGKPGEVAGFGPLSRTLRCRRSLLRGVTRRELDRPSPEVPADFDWAYFQAAPRDQQVDDLRGDERILLEGLHPQHESLWSGLPKVHGAARVFGLVFDNPYSHQVVDLRVDLVHVDGEAETVSLVLRAVIPIEDERSLPSVRALAGVATADEPVVWPEPPAVRLVSMPVPASGAPLLPGSGGDTVALGDAPSGSNRAVPFPIEAPVTESLISETRVLDPDEPWSAGRASPLPFAGARQPVPAEGGSPERAVDIPPPPRRALASIPGAPWSSVPVPSQASSDAQEITTTFTDEEDEPTRKIEDAITEERLPRKNAPAPESTAPEERAGAPESTGPAPPAGDVPPPRPSWSWAPSPAAPGPAPKPPAPRITQKSGVNEALYGGGFHGRSERP